MEWTRNKPSESGWYRYKGNLHSIDEEAVQASCDIPCKVTLYYGENPLLVIRGDSGLYDYDKTDGLWSGPEEPAEVQFAKEMAYDD